MEDINTLNTELIKIVEAYFGSIQSLLPCFVLLPILSITLRLLKMMVSGEGATFSFSVLDFILGFFYRKHLVKKRLKNIRKIRHQREILQTILDMENNGLVISLDTFKHYGLTDEYTRRLKERQDILDTAKRNAIEQLKQDGIIAR